MFWNKSGISGSHLNIYSILHPLPRSVLPLCDLSQTLQEKINSFSAFHVTPITLTLLLTHYDNFALRNLTY